MICSNKFYTTTFMTVCYILRYFSRLTPAWVDSGSVISDERIYIVLHKTVSIIAMQMYCISSEPKTWPHVKVEHSV